MIELRKVSKTRGHFPTDDALMKVLYLACREMGRINRTGQGGCSSYNWKAALNQFRPYVPRPPRPGLTSHTGHALTQKG
jgi:transposase-like protein